MTTTFDTASIESTANYTWYLLTQESELSSTQVDYLYRAMSDTRIRDEVLRLVVQQRETRPIWNCLAHHLGTVMESSTKLNAHVGSVMAIMAWLDGDEKWALEALGRVLDAEPEHSLSRLIVMSIGAGLPRQDWIEGALDLTREDCLRLSTEVKS